MNTGTHKTGGERARPEFVVSGRDIYGSFIIEWIGEVARLRLHSFMLQYHLSSRSELLILETLALESISSRQSTGIYHDC